MRPSRATTRPKRSRQSENEGAAAGSPPGADEVTPERVFQPPIIRTHISMTYEQQVMSELKALGDRHKAFTEAQKQSFGALQRQVDCIDSTMQRGMGNTSSGGASYGDGLREFKSFLETNKGDLEKHGRLQFSVPTFLDGQTKFVVLRGGRTGVGPAQGVFGAGRFAFKLRSLFRSIPATQPTIGVLRSVVETLATSPQVEGSLKAESI